MAKQSSRLMRRGRQIEQVAPLASQVDPHNARKPLKTQVEKIKRSINEFGLTGPILVDQNNKIIAGDVRLQTAIEMKPD